MALSQRLGSSYVSKKLSDGGQKFPKEKQKYLILLRPRLSTAPTLIPTCYWPKQVTWPSPKSKDRKHTLLTEAEGERVTMC